MLINIIRQIFQDCGFVEQQVDVDSQGYQYFLVSNSSESNRSEYFIVLEKSGATDEDILSMIKSAAAKFFDMIKASGKVDETFEKNCSMIFCYETPLISETMLLLEEDAFNFKKNVIPYTHEELESWKDTISGELTVECLNAFINPDQGVRFRAFKEKPSNDFYSLLMKIAVKLPIVHYKPPMSAQLGDLTKNILEKLTADNRKRFDFLLHIDTTKTNEEIENQLLEWSV